VNPSPLPPDYRPAPTWDRLDNRFRVPVQPAAFPKLTLRFRNDRIARRVGLHALDDDAWLRHFARFEPLPDNLAEPLALAYHGHQFRHYNPDIGDGRGFLYAQVYDPQGRLLDLGTKGSGRTPFSRTGDGRLTLKGAVRELLATELLEARGVPTSKTFSVVETHEPLQRHDEPSPTRSAVLVRLGHSHVRFGMFQRLATLGDHDALETFVDFAVTHYAAEARASSAPLAAALLRIVTERSAKLVAAWLAAGFVHGVLNTDNLNVTGESFDYGPWRFLPSWDPTFTAAYFDHHGLYAFGRQAEAVFWALQRLAESLLPLADEASLTDALQPFGDVMNTAFVGRFLARLGVESLGAASDDALVERAIALLRDSRVRYDGFFADWHGGMRSAERASASPRSAAYEGDAFDAFRAALRPYAPVAGPVAPTEPCGLLYPEVESLWASIDRDDDWAPLEAKVAAIRASAGLTAPR
jgi:serine/tyrosine/threonine adenylyltransferase